MLMNFKFYVKRFLLSLFLVLASTMLYAQKKADITGTVYDSDGTTPAVGCAVTIEEHRQVLSRTSTASTK